MPDSLSTDSLSEDSLLEDSLPNRSPGPRTPEGKAASSLNALKHGCCSEKTILRDEDPAEFEFVVQGWFDHYQPENPLTVALVQDLARAHWFLKRASKRLEEVEYELPSNAYHWTDSHQKLFANFSRYKTAAERAFLRYIKELETQLDKKERAAERRERALNHAALLERRWLDHNEKEAIDHFKADQFITVSVVDGQCLTDYLPPNDFVVKEMAARKKPPIFFSRILHFLHGVPPEYSWARPNEVQKVCEDFAIQKMFYKDWLDIIQQDAAANTGHIGPIGHLFLKSEP